MLRGAIGHGSTGSLFSFVVMGLKGNILRKKDFYFSVWLWLAAWRNCCRLVVQPCFSHCSDLY
jgi:hypothetical protein